MGRDPRVCGVERVGRADICLLTDQPWLIGAFPGVYGLIGGVHVSALATAGGETGGRRRRPSRLIGVLLALQLFFGVFFDAGFDLGGRMWRVLHGFVLLTAFVMPGGMTRALAVLRRR